MLSATCREYDIDMDAPVNTLPQDKVDIILYGTKGKEITVQFKSQNERRSTVKMAFEGVVNNLERRFRETSSDYVRARIQEYMSNKPCPTCHGARLRPESMAVTVDDKNIIEVTDWPVVRTLNGCVNCMARIRH